MIYNCKKRLYRLQWIQRKDSSASIGGRGYNNKYLPQKFPDPSFSFLVTQSRFKIHLGFLHPRMSLPPPGRS